MNKLTLNQALISISTALAASLIARDSWPQVAGLLFTLCALCVNIVSDRSHEDQAKALSDSQRESEARNEKAIKEVKEKVETLIMSSLGGGFR